MKKACTLLMWVATLTCFAQNPQDEAAWAGAVSKETLFPGGSKALAGYFRNSLNVPDSTLTKVEEKIYYKVTLGKDGKVSEVEIIRGGESCPSCAQAGLEAIRKMPAWVPAEYNGTPVKRVIMLPLTF